MLSKLVLRSVKRTLKRHQTGQAIIILALGFIILLGFVGIVTDVSLLYIRYASLRRAVDSAAVAAAGQIRTDRALTAPKLAAIQFLEFHGIRTSDVFVETCIDMPPDWGDPANVVDEATQDQFDLYNEVCNDQRKLVRVTAYIESPTVFMHLPPFNFETITLTASAISETASLDVVVVLDVSESMLTETTYDTWDRHLFGAGQGAADSGRRWSRWLPARFNEFGAEYERQQGLTFTNTQLRRQFLELYNDYDFRNWSRGGAVIPFVPINDASTGVNAAGSTIDFTPAEYYVDPGSGNLVVVDAGGAYFNDLYGLTVDGARPANIIQMRDECRVRINPYAAQILPMKDADLNLGNPNDITTLGGQYRNLAQLSDGTTGWSGNQWDMFQTAHDFYGCCNDPTANATVDITGGISLSANPADLVSSDFDFSDLVCQPFKQARDATRVFLQNIDFARGDRVAFVTFDRAAYLIDPDGYTYQTAASETRTFDGGFRSHMIDDVDVATEVLNRVIGVRAEPNFYYTDHNSTAAVEAGTGFKPVDTWESYSQGAITVQADTDGNGEVEDGEVVIDSRPLNDPGNPNDYQSGYFGQPVGNLTFGYHVYSSCPFQNAALPAHRSLWAAGDYGPLVDVMNPPITSNAAWMNHYEGLIGGGEDGARQWGALFSYENWGSCRGTNVGAGLREANNALVNPITTRQEGAVWVIVLLSDGAAGATDPIPFDDASTGIDLADPYKRIPNGAAPVGSAPDLVNAGSTYGAYGFCPVGSPSNVSAIMDDTLPPYCQDTNPDSRHSCNTDLDGNPNVKNDDREIDGVLTQQVTQNNIYPSGGNDDDCLNVYDADDYARDWADYVAMDRNLLSGEQLPAIFTIGFNLDYPNGTGVNFCQDNRDMCLGESLLRYIADIGDNNEWDGDYEFDEVGPGQDYGNYYNAPDEESLGRVFDEIAGKLFTRLAG
jgi:hypothetical protein